VAPGGSFDSGGCSASCHSFGDFSVVPTDARAGATAPPRSQPSASGPPDECMARMIRKSNRARSTSDAALLLL
jgi:hypothetical protein